VGDDPKRSARVRDDSAYVWFFLVASPVFVSISTFSVYSLTKTLTPEVIFPALAYFNLLRIPMTFMPMLIIGTPHAARPRQARC